MIRSLPRLGAIQTPVVLFAVPPLIAVSYVFGYVYLGGGDVIDFRPVHAAANALLDGDNPYRENDFPPLQAVYAYPPLTAILSIPLALLPFDVAGAVVMLGLAAGVAATLLVLSVRDWRCYALAFFWPPVLSAIQTGNLTILLGLGAALAWHFRERQIAIALSIGVTLAAKLFLWPLAVWLAATRRLLAAALSLAGGAAIVVASWAAIGFAGASDYDELLRRLARLNEEHSYSLYAIALDLGAARSFAHILGYGLAAALLAGVVVLGRRGDDRGAFILALAAALAFSPIVWLHYFELLLVAVAVAQPRLGPIWLVPLAMYVAPGTGNGTTAQAVVTLGAAVLTIGLSLRASSGAPLRPVISAPVRLSERSM